LATCRYILATGDASVLDQAANFLEGRPIRAEDDSCYDLPSRSDEKADVYQHCVRAILHGLRYGTHGLPLMGSGDWNDGMNLVGSQGKGESVWLAFFLCHVLKEFAKVARPRGDGAFADRCEKESTLLGQRIEYNGWDGEWYRRAYFDDGTPLGSVGNDECRIDSIAQSWSVLSGSGDSDRSRKAMDAVHQRLVRRDDALVQLLDPPFDKSTLDPGYIRGYVPGVRENGGQYTHAAIWAAMAFAALGDRARAWELMEMINPVNHALTDAGVRRYMVEPYVVAADVYALPPHTGRGGWSWYTGSAGWMYRLVMESLLGLNREADRLRIAPCMHPEWDEFTVRYRYGETLYRISVSRSTVAGGGNPEAIAVTVDGIAQTGNVVLLVDDGKEHRVDVRVAAIFRGSGAALAQRVVD
jgi:cellobiose phosphorylase